MSCSLHSPPSPDSPAPPAGANRTVVVIAIPERLRLTDDNKIRLIKVHHVRHTVGSLLKDLGVPARDAQTILGHTRISTTLEIYTDTDEQARRDALTRLQSLLGETQD